MKFKKRQLSEEIGLQKSNRKTYTQNKKQKIVLSENQLQRLISKINEATDPASMPAVFSLTWPCISLGFPSAQS